MKPVFQAAKAAPKRVVYAEGEEERVLRAVQVVVDEGIAFPVLLGRADVIARRIETLGLRLKVGETCEVVNILSDPRYPSVVAEYYELGRRQRRHPGHRQGGDAQPRLADRRHAAAAGRRRCHAVRHGRHLRRASQASCAR